MGVENMKSLEPELSIQLLGDFRLEYQNIPVEGV